MKAVVAAFNQEKALVGAFSVITNLRMDPFEALVYSGDSGATHRTSGLSITCPHAADNWSRLAFTYCAVPPTPSVAVPFSSTGEVSSSSTYIRRVYIYHVTCAILLSMPKWYMICYTLSSSMLSKLSNTEL